MSVAKGPGPPTLDFSPIGNSFAVTYQGTELRLYDGNSMDMVWMMRSQELDMSQVRFSPDGRFIAIGGTAYGIGGHSIQIWNVDSREIVATLEGHTQIVRSIDFSPDGRHLVSSSLDNTIRLWDLNDATELMVIAAPGSAAFSPDGKTIAVTEDGNVYLWDVSRLAQSAVLPLSASTYAGGHPLFGHSLMFGPHGNTVAVVTGHSNPQGVTIMDVSSGVEVARLEHRTGMSSVAYSPNGMRVATVTGGYNNDEETVIRLWDANLGVEIARRVHPGMLYSVDFNSDGTKLAYLTSDYAVPVWDIGVVTAVLEASWGSIKFGRP